MAGDDLQWLYIDSTGAEFGPYPTATMRNWYQQGFFPMQGDLAVRLSTQPDGTHYCIKDLYPEPLSERAFDDGKPNFPPPGRSSDSRRPYAGGGGGGSPVNPNAGLSPMMNHQGMAPFPGMGFPGMPMVHPGMAAMYPGADAGLMLPGGGAGGAGSRMFTGQIKSFNHQKGFGFIECQEAHVIYGRDVFLHKAQIGNMQQRDVVVFTVEMNKQNMPQARDVMPAGHGMAPGPGFGFNKGFGMQPNNGKGGYGGGGAGGGKGGGGRGKGGGGNGGGKGFSKAKGKGAPQRDMADGP